MFSGFYNLYSDKQEYKYVELASQQVSILEEERCLLVRACVRACVETGSSAVGSELSITLMCLFHYQHFDSRLQRTQISKLYGRWWRFPWQQDDSQLQLYQQCYPRILAPDVEQLDQGICNVFSFPRHFHITAIPISNIEVKQSRMFCLLA